MVDRQLLTDLVSAEMNIRNVIKMYPISFNDEVRKTFMEYQVESYFDLIKSDTRKAIELRRLAVKEHLLRR